MIFCIHSRIFRISWGEKGKKMCKKILRNFLSKNKKNSNEQK